MPGLFVYYGGSFMVRGFRAGHAAGSLFEQLHRLRSRV